MAEHVALGEVVAVSGSLMGAAVAIGLAWTRGARWLPPEEAVPRSTKNVAALICAVFISILYINRPNIGSVDMGAIAALCTIFTVIFLIITIVISVACSFDKRASRGSKSVRILGGFVLTREARNIRKEKGLSVQELFVNSHYQTHKVWTNLSRAAVAVISTLGFIGLQASGSIALASAAMLMGMSN